jgi:hypothetical protein
VQHLPAMLQQTLASRIYIPAHSIGYMETAGDIPCSSIYQLYIKCEFSLKKLVYDPSLIFLRLRNWALIERRMPICKSSCTITMHGNSIDQLFQPETTSVGHGV